MNEKELNLDDCTLISIALEVYRLFIRHQGTVPDYAKLLFGFHSESNIYDTREKNQQTTNACWRVINANRGT